MYAHAVHTEPGRAEDDVPPTYTSSTTMPAGSPSVIRRMLPTARPSQVRPAKESLKTGVEPTVSKCMYFATVSTGSLITLSVI